MALKKIERRDVVEVLTAPDDEDGFDADENESARLTNALFDALESNDPGEIADFIYTYCKWR